MHTLIPKAFLAFRSLSPQGQTVVGHMLQAGSITQREAILDHSIQSLTRRISEIIDAGIDVLREDKKHPLTQQRYAKYSLHASNLSN